MLFSVFYGLYGILALMAGFEVGNSIAMIGGVALLFMGYLSLAEGNRQRN